MMFNKYSTTRDLLISAIIGLLFFHLKMDISSLNPFNNHWTMMFNDISTNYIAWEFYRYEPWTFPLGEFHGYLFPYTSNICYTDSIPLFAILFKLITPLLPDQGFQYHGIFYYICYVLQLFFSLQLLKRLNIDSYGYRIIGACFVAAAPSFLLRFCHTALCSHWLIIASLYLFLSDYSTKKSNFYQFILLMISVWIHPYLLFIQLVLTIALMIRNILIDRNYRLFLTTLALVVVVPVINLYAIGYFSLSSQKMQGGGCGEFTANLNTFFNPINTSSILAPLVTKFDAQYEGYAYLGIGIWILLIIGLLTKNYFYRSPLFANRPLLFASLFLFLLALSFRITFYDTILFELNFTKSIALFFGIFRSSGRFIWVLYYLIIFSTLWSFYQLKYSTTVKIAALFTLFIIQKNDVKSLFEQPFWSGRKGTYESKLKSPIWDQVSAKSSHILFYPFLGTTCNENADYKWFSYYAFKNKIPISAGAGSRLDFDKMGQWRAQYEQQIQQGILFFPKAIFVISKKDRPIFDRLVSKNHMVDTFVDGYHLLYAPSILESK